MMVQTLGHNLNEADKKHVLAAYVHRYTKEHTPSWTKGKSYPVQFASDQEWLENTLFFATNSGKLDMRHKQCYSRPTWPNNPELRD